MGELSGVCLVNQREYVAWRQAWAAGSGHGLNYVPPRYQNQFFEFRTFGVKNVESELFCIGQGHILCYASINAGNEDHIVRIFRE